MEGSTEAPASVTYTIQRNGFGMLFTVRSESGMALLEAMETIEKKLTEKGYKPQEKRSFGGAGAVKKPVEYVPDKKCPKCGQPLVYATTKAGVKFIKCSTQTYDFKTGTKGGCDYTVWPPKEGTPDVINEEFNAF